MGADGLDQADAHAVLREDRSEIELLAASTLNRRTAGSLQACANPIRPLAKDEEVRLVKTAGLDVGPPTTIDPANSMTSSHLRLR